MISLRALERDLRQRLLDIRVRLRQLDPRARTEIAADVRRSDLCDPAQAIGTLDAQTISVERLSLAAQHISGRAPTPRRSPDSPGAPGRPARGIRSSRWKRCAPSKTARCRRRAETVVLPARVRDVVARRLDALTESAQRLIGAAAVIGRAFDFVLLRVAAGLGHEEKASGLEEMVRHHVQRYAPTGWSSHLHSGSEPIMSSSRKRRMNTTRTCCARRAHSQALAAPVLGSSPRRLVNISASAACVERESWRRHFGRRPSSRHSGTDTTMPASDSTMNAMLKTRTWA